MTDTNHKPAQVFAELIEDDFFVDNPNGREIREELNAFLAAYAKLTSERDLWQQATGMATPYGANKELERIAKERDELRAQLEELKSYMPKVPTEPYEKQMAMENLELKAELERVKREHEEFCEQAQDKTDEDFKAVIDNNDSLRAKLEACRADQNNLDDANIILSEKLTVCKEALEHYAEISRYTPNRVFSGATQQWSIEPGSIEKYDKGEKARDALKKLEE